MGTKETTIAYARLERDWLACNGRMTRLSVRGRKGVPDFFMTHAECGAALAEVKCVATATENIGVAALQAQYLDFMYGHGVIACVLVLCLDEHSWGIIRAGNLETMRKQLAYNSASHYSKQITPSFMAEGQSANSILRRMHFHNVAASKR